MFIQSSYFQPLDFMCQTAQLWFKEVPVPEKFVSVDPDDDPNATQDVQMKIWLSLTCQVYERHRQGFY